MIQSSFINYCLLCFQSMKQAKYVFQIKVGDRIEKVRFFHCYKRGVDRVFVDHPIFLEKVSNLNKHYF